MLKAFLIAAASLVSFDAVAWQGTMRHELVRETIGAVAKVSAHDWTWG
jgi:hypothetical protein